MSFDATSPHCVEVDDDDDDEDDLKGSCNTNGVDTIALAQISPPGAGESERAAMHCMARSELEEDVRIESENSAWDVLRERFEFAASAGRYIDLSNQSDENQHVSERDTDGAFKIKQGEGSRSGAGSGSGSGNLLSASDATEEFNRLPIPSNTIVRAETPHLRPELCAIKTVIQNVLSKLKAARDELISAMATGSQIKLCGCVFVCVLRHVRT